MTTKTAASQGSAAMQAQLWGRAVRDWAEYSEPLGRDLFEAALADLEIGTGTRLLDIGCGTGAFAAMAAARGATVHGLDATPEMLAIARERVPDGTFHEGDMEWLPYPDGAFDIVTGFNSFQYASNPRNAVAEARRVCRPGGSVLIAVWGRAEHCDMAPVLRALGTLLPPPPPGSPGPFALSADGALAALARDAGLEPLREKAVTSNWEFPNLEILLRSVLAAGPAGRVIQVAGLERTRAAITFAHEPFRGDDGRYRMTNEFIYLIARA